MKNGDRSNEKRKDIEKEQVITEYEYDNDNPPKPEMPEYRIERMAKEHIEGVYEVESLSFSVPWSKNSFIQELKNPLAYYLVILKDDKVAAFGGFWKVLDEAHVNNIAVHPDFRGKHLGDMIVEAMTKLAAEIEIREMTLEVRASNTPAKNLYTKYGFKMLGVRKEYYLDNKEDALLMFKKIGDQ